MNKHFYIKSSPLQWCVDVTIYRWHLPLSLSVHFDGVDTPPPADHSPQPGSLQAFQSEVASGHVVEHGVQTCVEDDERHGDPPSFVDGMTSGAALDDVHTLEEMQQVNHMVGQEAEHCDGQDGVNDLHSFLGCFGPNPRNASCCKRVAHQEDRGGQQGGKEQAYYAVRPQSLVPFCLGKVLKAAVA